MSQAKSYTIDKVGWHTKTPGNTEPREKTHARFRSIINFLQDNNLTVRTILAKEEPVEDDTSIHTDALTEKGRVVMKECYHKWIKKVDRGMDVQNLAMFENALSAIGDNKT